jgi:hypothetical protein
VLTRQVTFCGAPPFRGSSGEASKRPVLMLTNIQAPAMARTPLRASPPIGGQNAREHGIVFYNAVIQ